MLNYLPNKKKRQINEVVKNDISTAFEN
ncbi:hypothetical protein LM900277_180279 [Listeria monocytogenes]|nr:hypothetical protein LM500065_210265 [Listeria monocytogenes]CUK62125.1 hypothetical protein LM600983_10038 [Listeria monocytogenes]CUL07951.1 hypothetical protein LM701345_140278 [Listeria monocytogenes]CUL20909.1 hypothetical protein LM701481_140281 [Listeria monocytogenes]CUL45337.1 hypothetical protein LM7423_350155 [Listeria monocytogenes]